MNIHEHQAKEILKKYGAKVPRGVFAFKVEDLLEKANNLNRKIRFKSANSLRWKRKGWWYKISQ